MINMPTLYFCTCGQSLPILTDGQNLKHFFSMPELGRPFRPASDHKVRRICVVRTCAESPGRSNVGKVRRSLRRWRPPERRER